MNWSTYRTALNVVAKNMELIIFLFSLKCCKRTLRRNSRLQVLFLTWQFCWKTLNGIGLWRFPRPRNSSNWSERSRWGYVLYLCRLFACFSVVRSIVFAARDKLFTNYRLVLNTSCKLLKHFLAWYRDHKYFQYFEKTGKTA